MPSFLSSSMPYFYLLLRQKRITNIMQRKRVFTHYSITLFLCFKFIRDIVQLSWVHLNCFNTSLIVLKCTASLYISWILYWSGIRLNDYESMCIASSQICWVYRWFVTYFNDYCSMCTALWHICWVLKQLGIRNNVAGMIRIIWFHICWVFRWSGTYYIEYGSMYTTLLHISCDLKWLEAAMGLPQLLSCTSL